MHIFPMEWQHLHKMTGLEVILNRASQKAHTLIRAMTKCFLIWTFSKQYLQPFWPFDCPFLFKVASKGQQESVWGQHWLRAHRGPTGLGFTRGGCDQGALGHNGGSMVSTIWSNLVPALLLFITAWDSTQRFLENLTSPVYKLNTMHCKNEKKMLLV